MSYESIVKSVIDRLKAADPGEVFFLEERRQYVPGIGPRVACAIRRGNVRGRSNQAFLPDDDGYLIGLIGIAESIDGARENLVRRIGLCA